LSPVKADERKESIVSVTSDKKLEEPKEDSRPVSQASAASEKVASEHEDEKLSPVKADERKESIVSVTSEKKLEEPKDDSRPVSQASAKISQVKADERKESIASVTEYLYSTVSNQVSVSKPVIIGFVRPKSPASDGEDIDSKETELFEEEITIQPYECPKSPGSVSSQISDKAKSDCEKDYVDINIRRKSSVSVASDIENIDDKFSRPETPSSVGHESEQDEQKFDNDEEIKADSEYDDRRESYSKTERLLESRKEGQKTLDDSVCSFPMSKEFDLTEDKIFMKESRSKSVSSICSTSSRSEDFGKLSAIEEIITSSREDIKTFTKTQVDISKISTTQYSQSTDTGTISTSFPLVSDKSGSMTIPQAFPVSDESSKLESLSQDSIQKLTTIEVTKTSTESTIETTEGKKTPPTAPISPSVQKSSTQITSQEVTKVADVTYEKTYEYSTPRDSIHSGRSSPDSAASKSIVLGQGSAVESPESSPKPTSPFPKTIDALRTDDDRKTSSGISTPDMTRTSTPDTTEKFVELKTSSVSAIKEEKSEFISKVHTQEYSYHTESKEIFPDQTSYHTEWTSSLKKGDEDNAYGTTEQQIYEEEYDGKF
jgi:hypothetical protein